MYQNIDWRKRDRENKERNHKYKYRSVGWNGGVIFCWWWRRKMQEKTTLFCCQRRSKPKFQIEGLFIYLFLTNKQKFETFFSLV